MMLLSHFSPFLEIITGVYISMCMDDVLKGIWSPKYYDDLKFALKEYYLQNHDDLIMRIVDTNKSKADSIKHYMKNRAAFFFVICLILLFLSGFETNLVTSNDYSFHMSMFFIVIWAVVLLVFNKYLFSTKQRTAKTIILLVVLSYISFELNINYLGLLIPSDIIIGFVLLVLILPILWQTFVCWMFSSAYKGYISNKLVEGKQNYEKAEKGLSEHNPDIIPKRYKDIYTKLSIQSNDAEKAKQKCLDHYLELMENEITEASAPKSVFKIFISWILFYFATGLNNLAILFHLKKRNTIAQKQP